MMREAQKSSFANVIWSKLNIADQETLNIEVDYVIDRGVLLCRIPWLPGSPTCKVSLTYVACVAQKYGQSTIVFYIMEHHLQRMPHISGGQRKSGDGSCIHRRNESNPENIFLLLLKCEEQREVL